MTDLDALIEAADLNGLLRAVDALCERREWEELADLADRCEHAVERGKQLWPIAAHIDYRMALEAPGPYAARVLHPEVGRFALGPLTEVAASTHRWDELAPHIETPQLAAYVAQERVLRGEVLDGDRRAHPEVLELPLHLMEWEPSYTLATYRRDHVEVSEPWTPKAPMEEVHPDADVAVVDDHEIVDALLDLVQPWVSESNGAARAVVVEGDGAAAASALTLGPFRIGALSFEEAVQRIAWAAASGGAHGRRRGATYGRLMAFHLIGLLAGIDPFEDPDAPAEAASRLAWHLWDEGEREEGWILRLAVADRARNWAAAIAATDVLEEAVDL